MKINIVIGIIGLIAINVAMAEEIFTGTSISGSAQIEGRYYEDYAAVNSSDFVVDEVAVAIETQVNKWVKGLIGFLYEEDETPLEVDEAIITLGNSAVSPLYFAAGQMYVPFGNFETSMISDPLTLELGEAREKAAQIGFTTANIYGSLYAFNGSTQNNSEDTIDHYGINLGFAQENDSHSYDLGIGYISDIGDTDGLTDALGGDDVTNLVGYDYVAGLSTHIIVTIGDVSLVGEYVTALDTFNPDNLAFNDNGAEPKAWNIEAGYSFPLMGKATTLALGYQGTDEAVAMELPAERYSGSLTMEVYRNTTLAFEYALEEDYATSDGGTGEDAHRAALQLGFQF